MSTRSDNYEKKCVQELISLGYDASWLGGSDSTVPDIKVKKFEDDYHIEVKMRRAQGAQFLVNFVDDKFIYSSMGNDAFAIPLVNLMNDNKDEYKKSGTHVVSKDQKLCFDYVSDYYRNKGVRYFATKIKNKWKFTAIDDLLETYILTAYYRKKKSGSRSLPKKDDKYFSSLPFIRRGKKAFVTDKIYAKTYIGTEFYINESLEVRKLSNRADSCIIFQFKSKK